MSASPYVGVVLDFSQFYAVTYLEKAPYMQAIPVYNGCAEADVGRFGFEATSFNSFDPFAFEADRPTRVSTVEDDTLIEAYLENQIFLTHVYPVNEQTQQRENIYGLTDIQKRQTMLAARLAHAEDLTQEKIDGVVKQNIDTAVKHIPAADIESHFITPSKTFAQERLHKKPVY